MDNKLPVNFLSVDYLLSRLIVAALRTSFDERFAAFINDRSFSSAYLYKTAACFFGSGGTDSLRLHARTVNNRVTVGVLQII